MVVSLCITVFNEGKHIKKLLESIVHQTKKADEVIIIDGGSSDATVAIIKEYASRIPNLKLLVKKGNRPFGRNESIRQAKGEIIAITDAGCELDIHWLEEIIKPFSDQKIQVVSGYYKGKPKSALEEALVPYVLVMPDRINSSSFLPSTRSMAMRKRIWEEIGGFPEEYPWNEDYVFSKRIEKKGMTIAFAEKAIVYWFPRETVIEGWKMFYAFAKGDAQAGIWRKKVFLVFFRGIFMLFLLGYIFIFKSFSGVLTFILLIVLYITWIVWKNYRYIKHPPTIFFLPLWQITSDIAVFWGSFIGCLDRIKTGQKSNNTP